MPGGPLVIFGTSLRGFWTPGREPLHYKMTGNTLDGEHTNPMTSTNSDKETLYCVAWRCGLHSKNAAVELTMTASAHCQLGRSAPVWEVVYISQ